MPTVHQRENAKWGDERVRLGLGDETQPGDRNVDARSIHRILEAMRLDEITRGVNASRNEFNTRKYVCFRDIAT